MTEETVGEKRRRFLDAKEEPNKWLNPVEGYEEKSLVSLEESVERIKTLINDEPTIKLVGEIHIRNLVESLDKKIFVAKKNSQNPEDGLTEEESAAIRLYTMEWKDSNDNLCTILGKVLRSEKRDILKPWFSYLKLFLTALFKLPSKKGTIWRGIRGNVSEQYQKEKVWWGFSSCTETLSQIDQFLGKCDERTMFMIDCVNGKAIRNHSHYSHENEILLMPGSYFRVIDQHSPAKDLYIIHLQETTPPYELLAPPFKLDPSTSAALPTSDVGIVPEDTTNTHAPILQSHEITTAVESGSTEVRRLFYVNHDDSSKDKQYRFAIDSEHVEEVVQVLHQLNPAKQQFFGIFGERIGLETCLYSLFPNQHTHMDSMFSKIDSMPTIWAIYNSINFAFVLIPAHHNATISEKENYFMVIFQQYLQDMCRNILICPSDAFFSNFSAQSSFHGQPRRTRRYRQVKTESVNVKPPEQVKLENEHLLSRDQCQNVLITNNSSHAYCVQKTLQGTKNSKYDKLKELLQTQINYNSLSQHEIVKLCQENEIPLSSNQESKIVDSVTSYMKAVDMEKALAKKQANLMIEESLDVEDNTDAITWIVISLGKTMKEKLLTMITDWLIDLKWEDENVKDFANRMVDEICKEGPKKHQKIHIANQQIDMIASHLQRIDRKKKIRQVRENFIEYICIIVQSDNPVEVHFNIHRLHYRPSNDIEHGLRSLTIIRHTPIQFSLDHFDRLMDIAELTETDRGEFSRRIECAACFKISNGSSEIIVIKRPNIISKSISPSNGLSILLYRNGILQKLTELTHSQIFFAYSSKSNSQILVAYDYANGKVTRFSLDEFGQSQLNASLRLHNQSKRPVGVKSLALTVSQELLILIDFNSIVYSINLAEGNTPMVSLVYKTSNSEPYQEVRTIGEKSSIFFFQAKSCIDITDENYVRIYTIQLNQKLESYKMQIFTDFIDTYCVLFNAQANEVYCFPKLISNTRIERQDSVDSLDRSTQLYIGNRLLDIIKQGEVKFGIPKVLTRTRYHFVISSEHAVFSNHILNYFANLDVKSQLKINYDVIDLADSSLDAGQVIKILLSRIPLQLCALEMGNLIPLSNGRRDHMDYLSSKPTRIAMIANKISFAYLDTLLNEIGENENLRVVGIIGRQSNGTRDLLNKIFHTRFVAQRDQRNDGIWMSYACLEGTHFIILNCAGLFSDQRTGDEELKLLSFFAAVCDITILNKDLALNRFEDQLFVNLSRGANKITRNDKLFKGILLVAVRDMIDMNAVELLEAVEQKFLDLQRRGRDGFLDQLFSNVFIIESLHPFENRNFDYDVKRLREFCINHAMSDLHTGVKLSRRWENGKVLADYLKILLVQLYTDDLTDSNGIYADLESARLEKDVKDNYLSKSSSKTPWIHF